MRKRWIISTFALLMSVTTISGCGVSYKDYTETRTTQEETEQTAGLEVNREYEIEPEVAKLPEDVVIIDDYSNVGSILTSGKSNCNISMKVNKTLLADNMDAYKEIGGTDENFIEWIKQVNARESAFTNRYDEADGTFESIYEGIGTKILMISAELINNEDSEAVINIDGIKPYIMDKAKGEITRLSITESIFHDYAKSTGSDRGNITLNGGEHRNIVLCMAEPDKIIRSYYRSESNKNVATATEDINYDNIYLRLSLWGVQQVAKGENFIKFNAE